MKRVVVTDRSRGLGALVAGALDVLGVDVALMAQESAGTHGQEAAAWLAMMIDAEPDALVVSHVQVRGRGVPRGAVQTAEAVLAAAARCPTLRKVVLLSSGQVYGARDSLPTFVPERLAPDRSGAISSVLLQVEDNAVKLASARPDIAVTVLRPTEVLGFGPHGLLADHLHSSGSFITADLGYDPQVQFTTDHDVAIAIIYALREEVPGVFNYGPIDALPLSELIRLSARFRIGTKRVGTVLAGVLAKKEPWSRELAAMLRYGRALDASTAAAASFPPAAPTSEAVRGWRDACLARSR